MPRTVHEQVAVRGQLACKRLRLALATPELMHRDTDHKHTALQILSGADWDAGTHVEAYERCVAVEKAANLVERMNRRHLTEIHQSAATTLRRDKEAARSRQLAEFANETVMEI